MKPPPDPLGLDRQPAASCPDHSGQAGKAIPPLSDVRNQRETGGITTKGDCPRDLMAALDELAPGFAAYVERAAEKGHVSPLHVLRALLTQINRGEDRGHPKRWAIRRVDVLAVTVAILGILLGIAYALMTNPPTVKR